MTTIGPIGAIIINGLKGLPGTLGDQQRMTIIRVLQVCGDLWAKEIVEADIPLLQERVIETICLVEAHLPASELDIKLHNLLHLCDDNLRQVGESFCGTGLNLMAPLMANF